VEYSARSSASDVIRVDGRVVCRESSLAGHRSRFDFMVPGTFGPLSASLEVRISLWQAVAAVRLRVDGRTVYSESDASTGPADRLPIPAAAEVIPPRPHALPRPAREPQLLAASLPRASACTRIRPRPVVTPRPTVGRVRTLAFAFAIALGSGAAGVGLMIAAETRPSREPGLLEEHGQAGHSREREPKSMIRVHPEPEEILLAPPLRRY
jgi:hypothetical protein